MSNLTDKSNSKKYECIELRNENQHLKKICLICHTYLLENHLKLSNILKLITWAIIFCLIRIINGKLFQLY